MTNQAAQTMPELPPASAFLHNMAHNPLYTADQMHQYARDYAAALSQTAGVQSLDGRVCGYTPGQSKVQIALDVGALPEWLELGWPVRVVNPAAPAASGGEPPSAASVSERARELLAAQYDAEGWDTEANACRRGISDAVDRFALRALEQALTQQRGECPWKDAVLDALANTAMDAPVETEPAIIVAKVIAWHERLSTNPPDAPAMRITIIQKGDAQAIREWHNDAELPAGTYSLFTTPQPSADAVRELQDEVDRLNAIVNTPQSNDFLRAVSTEAEHQRQRWGSDHDAGKTPADWFWLVGYLAGKALHAHAAGDAAKAEHHIITTAAALANWHLAAFGKTDMRPGIDGESLLSGGSNA